MYLGYDGVLLEQRGNVLRPRSKIERPHEALVPPPLGTGNVLCRAVTRVERLQPEGCSRDKVGKTLRMRCRAAHEPIRCCLLD